MSAGGQKTVAIQITWKVSSGDLGEDKSRAANPPKYEIMRIDMSRL